MGSLQGPGSEICMFIEHCYFEGEGERCAICKFVFGAWRFCRASRTKENVNILPLQPPSLPCLTGSAPEVSDTYKTRRLRRLNRQSIRLDRCSRSRGLSLAMLALDLFALDISPALFLVSLNPLLFPSLNKTQPDTQVCCSVLGQQAPLGVSPQALGTKTQNAGNVPSSSWRQAYLLLYFCTSVLRSEVVFG